jgi:hypothetical protein
MPLGSLLANLLVLDQTFAKQSFTQLIAEELSEIEEFPLDFFAFWVVGFEDAFEFEYDGGGF